MSSAISVTYMGAGPILLQINTKARGVFGLFFYPSHHHVEKLSMLLQFASIPWVSKYLTLASNWSDCSLIGCKQTTPSLSRHA
ncbi:hypothetical protein CISG_07216 [Coccidioides immitis RMSCC 3703]|uniref:Uncharacterized protein n=1 Tax=Coccidioides immitis RMSCC 3703 TaxID=454286 RepID=A0A0J8R1E2_COCIT|nr:hypothetical protein CISG_07216 [Coccidioides immitis RMSCC 3703]